jgi:flagellar biosynthesis protein FlhG
MENRQFATPAKTAERSVPVLTFSSGKGGVGKSCLSAHLGTMLARSGLRVLLVDGDFGLANLDILLNVNSAVTLDEVLAGRARIQDAVIGVEPNLWLLPASAGLLEVRDFGTDLRERMARLFNDCPWEMDVILVDIGAGIQSNVLSLHSPVFRTVIVLSPDPTSLTDAYGLIKLLRRHCGVTQVSAVVNQVTDGREARAVYQRLRDVASRFIDVQIDYLGHWEKDEKIARAVMKRKILLDWDKGAKSIPSLQLLAKQVRSRFLDGCPEISGYSTENSGESAEGQPVSGERTAGFWRTVLGVSALPVSMSLQYPSQVLSQPPLMNDGMIEVKGKA